MFLLHYIVSSQAELKITSNWPCISTKTHLTPFPFLSFSDSGPCPCKRKFACFCFYVWHRLESPVPGSLLRRLIVVAHMTGTTTDMFLCPVLVAGLLMLAHINQTSSRSVLSMTGMWWLFSYIPTFASHSVVLSSMHVLMRREPLVTRQQDPFIPQSCLMVGKIWSVGAEALKGLSSLQLCITPTSLMLGCTTEVVLDRWGYLNPGASDGNSFQCTYPPLLLFFFLQCTSQTNVFPPYNFL